MTACAAAVTAGHQPARRSSVRCSLSILPPSTCTEAAAQARSALRRLRDAASEGGGGALGGSPPPRRLTVRLPLPSPEAGDDAVRAYSQADWPGGILQRFRRLRPLIEGGLLDGYSPEFVGMLESPADGIGVWRAAGGSLTVVCQVGNLNFAPFARLCGGEFGAAVLEPEHTIVAVNPTWTSSRDIGQLWDKKLKAAAAALIDEPGAWLPLYHLRDVRTARGATGFLYRSWPHDWQLHSTCGQEAEEAAALAGPPLLVTPSRPTKDQVAAALDAALAEQRAAQKERQPQRWPW